MNPHTDRIIMGVDPGTVVTGYGLIHIQGSLVKTLDLGSIQLGKTGLDHPQKLSLIFHQILALIDRHKPDELAVEAPFYGKNAQVTLKLGRAQGVVMAAAMLRSVPVVEYAPRRIKQSVTGRGTSSKEQVKLMLAALLPDIVQWPVQRHLDATDGLAVAYCHYLQRGVLGKADASEDQTKPRTQKAAQSYSGWAAFVAQNPERAQ